MAETAFQSQLSGVMEALFKAAIFEITRLVEDNFIDEVSRCREQVDTLKRRLKMSESRRKQRETDTNMGCANCGGTKTGQTVTETNVKQEGEMTADVSSPQAQGEVKYEVTYSPVAGQSTSAQSKKINRGKRPSEVQDLQKFGAKRDSSDDELCVPGSSSQLSDPKYQLNWETQKSQSDQNGGTDYSSELLYQNQYGMDDLNNLSNTGYEDTNIASIDDAYGDDDLVYMGQYEDGVKPPKANEQQSSETGESKEKSGTRSSPNTSREIDCLLINEEGHLQNPDNIHSDHVDSDQNVNCVDDLPSDRTDGMLGEPNTMSDISHMIEMLQQQSMENGLHTCNLCLATFPDLATLKAHRQTHKEPERGLPYLCNQRRKTFTRTCNLKSQGPHLCGHCGKTFPSLFKLQKHKCEQMGDKPYSCAICGNKFSRLWNLKLHRRIHTQEKPHHCTMCDKSFTRADILKVHQRTHTGERPYCCLVCGLNFKRLDHLKSHQRKHMPDQ
ncbi:uncharacterized protein [Eucyclogobius newberryi]|uniref:uncharacterized protein n=1 Tax=Eucyclogobius newberryi TaxID=166745 RepID=UPI003B5CEE0C